VKPDLIYLTEAIKTVPTQHIKGTLASMVPFKDLSAYSPPNWLYTSGKPNRFNPTGVNCVYFAETDAVAKLEYEDLWKRTSAAHQPRVTFYAEVELSRVIDLSDTAVLKALKLEQSDLFESWRLAAMPTSTQFLGQAVNHCERISAIRYPSKAAVKRGHGGCNVVIFQKNVLFSSDFVRILGPEKGKPLQAWP
jgi:RES domain-containing protein